MTSMQQNDKQTTESAPGFAVGLWGVRYQVRDVQRSIAFYTQTLGFNLDQQYLPAFGQVSIGNLKLILSGPGASGSRPMPDGRQQEPGGWNRVILQVQDLSARIGELKQAAVRFRMRWKSVRAENRFRSKIRTATRLNCSSLLTVECSSLTRKNGASGLVTSVTYGLRLPFHMLEGGAFVRRDVASPATPNMGKRDKKRIDALRPVRLGGMDAAGRPF